MMPKILLVTALMAPAAVSWDGLMLVPNAEGGTSRIEASPLATEGSSRIVPAYDKLGITITTIPQATAGPDRAAALNCVINRELRTIDPASPWLPENGYDKSPCPTERSR